MTDAQSTHAGSSPEGHGPLGNVRHVWLTLVLIILTLGIYGLWWYYKTHKEMREFSGDGLGGWPALIFAIIPILGIILWFTVPTEVARLYEGQEKPSPVRSLTGLWMLIPIAGGIIWFYKVQSALNAFWGSEIRALVKAAG